LEGGVDPAVVEMLPACQAALPAVGVSAYALDVHTAVVALTIAVVVGSADALFQEVTEFSDLHLEVGVPVPGGVERRCDGGLNWFTWPWLAGACARLPRGGALIAGIPLEQLHLHLVRPREERFGGRLDGLEVVIVHWRHPSA